MIFNPYFDPMYLVFALPALLLALYAQMKVRSAYARYTQVPNHRGITGLDAARRILGPIGLSHVQIEETPGELTDHYDPRTKTLRLSQEVAYGRSVAALAIVMHEVGHALQDAQGYAPLKLRGALVPTIIVSSWVAPLLFMAGWLMGSTGLAWLGVGGFAAAAVFSLVTLPVEFNASYRGLQLLQSFGLAYGEELQQAKAVLDAAALTYVAALVQALSTLLYYMSLLIGFNRQEE
ncbi:MAG: zinc metallopeptidase [Anaerolineae bacterium]|nr:zinc metallopeptidase [Anaerolineae bacterium]MDW8100218.1 zinc metallopeptidase [Anaerolineae bacterium]